MHHVLYPPTPPLWHLLDKQHAEKSWNESDARRSCKGCVKGTRSETKTVETSPAPYVKYKFNLELHNILLTNQMIPHTHISASVHGPQMNEWKSVTEIQISVKNKMFPITTELINLTQHSEHLKNDTWTLDLPSVDWFTYVSDMHVQDNFKLQLLFNSKPPPPKKKQ